jgi:predicted secreted protein
MGPVLTAALFFIIWWTMLFAVLPFFTRTQAEAGDVVPGTPESAPAAFKPLMILVVTTAASLVVLAIVWSLFHFKIIDIDAMLARGLG